MVWVIAAAAARAHAAGDAAHFPTLSGQNLLDTEVTLPADLPAARSLVLLGFDEDQHALLRAWLGRLEAVAPGIPWIEVAVLGHVNAFVKGMIGAAMRREIEDPEDRARTLRAFVAPEALARTAGCRRAPKLPCVLIVEQGGDIDALVEGAVDEVGLQRLLQSLQGP